MEDQFETLESAYDFVALLAETVAEAKRELESDVQRESASNPSRQSATAQHARHAMRLPLGWLGDGTQSGVSLQKSLAA